MYFRAVYWHKPDPELTEHNLLSVIRSSNKYRRVHEETTAFDENNVRWPVTLYYVQTLDEETVTILKLQGYDVMVLTEEPRLLRMQRINYNLKKCTENGLSQ